jgi:hypothetical protein
MGHMSEPESRYTNREGSLDELATGLGLPSGNFSRGKALRIMGAALVGGALAAFPGAAWSKEKLDKEKKPKEKKPIKGEKPDPDAPPTLP